MTPADELVDIVDADDRVVGRATRREMRSAGLRHRAVYVLVFNGRGEIFVHKRTTTKDVCPGFYDVAAGGVVGAGESYDEAAERELAEELGIRTPLERLFALCFEEGDLAVNGVVYRCSSEGPFELQPSEVESGAFASVDEVLRRAGEGRFCPDSLEALRLYLRRA